MSGFHQFNMKEYYKEDLAYIHDDIISDYTKRQKLHKRSIESVSRCKLYTVMVSLIYRPIIQRLLHVNQHNTSIATCVITQIYDCPYINNHQLAFICNCVYL